MWLPLDLTLLTPRHLWFFGGAFVAVYVLVGSWLRRTRGTTGRPKHMGTAIVVATSMLAYVVVADTALRIGLVAAAVATVLVGSRDERQPLSAAAQLWAQIGIAATVVLFGWMVFVVSNPWEGGVIALDGYRVGSLVFPGSVLAIGWLVFLMNAMNWLDGVDGLAGGVGSVALLTLAAVSLLPSIQDALTLQLALIGAAAMLGFLVWNFSPARAYLGTVGSWWLGLYIGMVAVVGGGKLVTTLLVLALPVLDVAAVVLQRILTQQSVWQGDRVWHLHHYLLARGWSARTIAATGMLCTAAGGAAAIYLQTQMKVVVFVLVACMMGILSVWRWYAWRKGSVLGR